MNNEDIILFSSDDWGWKTSKYQLSTRFCQKNRVLFISSIGFRSPTVSAQDIGRIFEKLKSFFNGIKKIENNLYVLTPLVLPFRSFPFVKKINTFLLHLQIKYAKWKLKLYLPYIFVFSQNWYDFVKDIPRKKLVYYCVDDQSGFKGINSTLFELHDRLLAEQADIVICSSRMLYEYKKAYNLFTYYLPHGVNYELFSRVVFDAGLKVASDVSDLPKPVIGFYGHISSDWVDVDLLKFLASQCPKWSFLLIGKYSLHEETFKDFKNIYTIGPKEFEDLPSYCKGIDAGIIPFTKSVLTDNCNPLKLYEYLAAGLSVVSTDIPEVRQYKDSVFIAKTNDEFLDCCRQALLIRSSELDRERSLRFKNTSWDNRVDEIYKLLSM